MLFPSFFAHNKKATLLDQNNKPAPANDRAGRKGSD